jgi:hypothetical protein
LSTEQSAAELVMLNPVAASSRSVLAPVRNNKNTFIATRGSTATVCSDNDLVHTEDVPVDGYKCTNSTGVFVPPYWTFVFSDVDLRDHVCVSINIPSGLCDKQYGLEGKVDASVAPCGTKLVLACEWPETLTTAHCMEDELSEQWEQEGKYNGLSTVSNILHSFAKELHKIRVQNKCTQNSMLGAKASIELPFQVEPEMVLCEPCLAISQGSVTL